jgi:hypothetical protein
MPTPHIVANLLRLSSEAQDIPGLVSPALDLIAESTAAEAVAVIRATPPSWSTLASRGVAANAIPFDMAADTLERDTITRNGRWLAAPLRDHGRAGADHRATSLVLLLHGSCLDSQFQEIADAIADAIAVVDQNAAAHRQARRLETILNITHEWHQTNEMETLLVRMAEAATEMFAADRASIFLWDKANKTIVGRPALGVAGGELRLPDDAGIVGQVVQTGPRC